MARELPLIAVLAVLAACGRDQPATSAPAASGPAEKAEAGKPPLASKAFYRVDSGPETPCASGATCERTVVLTALGDYHVNKEYPFKFVGEPAPALALDGNASFAIDDDAKRGTLTIRFKPTAAGPATLAGVFKLSVCSDDTCEIEKPKLELAVAVR
jgi:hypothetical protein